LCVSVAYSIYLRSAGRGFDCYPTALPSTVLDKPLTQSSLLPIPSSLIWQRRKGGDAPNYIGRQPYRSGVALAIWLCVSQTLWFIPPTGSNALHQTNEHPHLHDPIDCGICTLHINSKYYRKHTCLTALLFDLTFIDLLCRTACAVAKHCSYTVRLSFCWPHSPRPCYKS